MSTILFLKWAVGTALAGCGFLPGTVVLSDIAPDPFIGPVSTLHTGTVMIVVGVAALTGVLIRVIFGKKK